LKGEFEMGAKSATRISRVTLSAAGTYASGDQIGATFAIPDALMAAGHGAILQSLQLIDKSNSKLALELHLFNSAPTMTSADNDPVSITDAELATKFLAKIEIAAADYDTVLASGNAVWTATPSQMGIIVDAANGATSIYGLLVTRGAPTYAANDLVFAFGFLQD
jgi:hypothetical protein